MSSHNGCIFMISSRVKVLKLCLELLFKNYNNKFKYPVLIFYFDDIYTKEFIDDIHKNINENIKFINIDYKIPENINESELFYNRTYLNYVKKCFSKNRIGYLHANYFWNNFFKYNELLQYDWGMRIDDDSFFINSIDFDFFEILNKNNYMFGSGYTKNDVYPNERDCRQELHNFTRDFCNNYKIEPKNKFLKKCLEDNNDEYLMGPNKKKREKTELIWNCGNCNVYNMKMFKTENWKKWNDKFNKFAGGYKYRWGDIEVIGLYAYIFLDKPLYDFKLKKKKLYETGNTNFIRVGTAPSTKK